MFQTPFTHAYDASAAADIMITAEAEMQHALSGQPNEAEPQPLLSVEGSSAGERAIMSLFAIAGASITGADRPGFNVDASILLALPIVAAMMTDISPQFLANLETTIDHISAADDTVHLFDDEAINVTRAAFILTNLITETTDVDTISSDLSDVSDVSDATDATDSDDYSSSENE